MDEEEEQRAQARDARAGFTPAACGRVLNASADIFEQFRKREEQHDRHDLGVQERILALYDQVGLLHGVIREKDTIIAELRRDDRDLKAEEIKAGVEQAKIEAKLVATEQLFAFLQTLAKELPEFAAKARSYRGGTEEDQTYAQGLWIATGALLQAMEKDPALFEQIQNVAPKELIELVRVLKSYKSRSDNR